jgi:electron transport complex protein RnfG
MTVAEAGPARMIFTLGVAGLLSGATLVGAYTATYPMIERNKAAALEAALYKVLPSAESRKAFVVEDDVLVAFASEDGSLPQGEAIYAGYDASGRRVGFAIPAMGPGFQDNIGLLYGFDPVERKVTGMRVLQSLETPGLGDKIIKDDHFVGEFEGLAVDPEIVLVKDGGDGLPNEVDSITGATISSKAIVAIINAGNARWLDLLPKGGEEGP